MLTWPFTTEATLLVQGIGFWLGVVGIILGLIGFGLTLSQLRKTVAATAAVKEELSRVKASLHIYDANHELAKATQALQSAKKHLVRKEWTELAQDYADLIASMHIVLSLGVEGVERYAKAIMICKEYGNKICERIEGVDPNSVNIDIAKTGSAIREHEQLVSSLNILLQGRALS